MNISQAYYNLLLGLFAKELEQYEFALKHTSKDDEDPSLARSYEVASKVWEEMNTLLHQARQNGCEITFGLASPEQGK